MIVDPEGIVQLHHIGDRLSIHALLDTERRGWQR